MIKPRVRDITENIRKTIWKDRKLGGMRIVLGVGPKRTSLARVPDVVRRYNGAGEIDTR